MSSGQENTSRPARDIVQSPTDMSTPTSPTDTRHPLARVESATQQTDGLSESFQSTATVRRRLEPQYGMRIFNSVSPEKENVQNIYVIPNTVQD
jgi:Ca2+:H+ antiporter